MLLAVSMIEWDWIVPRGELIDLVCFPELRWGETAELSEGLVKVAVSFETDLFANSAD